MNNASAQRPRYMNATNSSESKKQVKYTQRKTTSSPFKALYSHIMLITEPPYNIKYIKHNDGAKRNGNGNGNGTKAGINLSFAEKFVNKPNTNTKHKNKDNFEGGIGTFMNTNAKKKIRHYSYDYNNSICTARVVNPWLNEEGLKCKVKVYKGGVTNRNNDGCGGLWGLFERTPSKFFNKGKKRCLTQEGKENEIFSKEFLYDTSVGRGKGKKRNNGEPVGLRESAGSGDWGWGKGKKRVLPLSYRNSNDNIFFN